MKTILVYLTLCVSLLLFTPAILRSASALFNPVLRAHKDLCLLYDHLQLGHKGLSVQAFAKALEGFESRKESLQFNREDVLTIIDFTLPSNQKRLFILDLLQGKLMYQTLVAHGKGSGYISPEYFSNKPGSWQSSPGFYRTAGTYLGKNGLSLTLCGLDKGLNDRAEERAVVMHGADYVSENFLKQRGYLGRSWGCPAVPRELTTAIINDIKGGSCLYIHTGH